MTVASSRTVGRGRWPSPAVRRPRPRAARPAPARRGRAPATRCVASRSAERAGRSPGTPRRGPGRRSRRDRGQLVEQDRVADRPGAAGPDEDEVARDVGPQAEEDLDAAAPLDGRGPGRARRRRPSAGSASSGRRRHRRPGAAGVAAGGAVACGGGAAPRRRVGRGRGGRRIGPDARAAGQGDRARDRGPGRGQAGRRAGRRSGRAGRASARPGGGPRRAPGRRRARDPGRPPASRPSRAAVGGSARPWSARIASMSRGPTSPRRRRKQRDRTVGQERRLGVGAQDDGHAGRRLLERLEQGRLGVLVHPVGAPR